MVLYKIRGNVNEPQIYIEIIQLFSRQKDNVINMVDCGVAVTNGIHLSSTRFPLALMRPRILFLSFDRCLDKLGTYLLKFFLQSQ